MVVHARGKKTKEAEKAPPPPPAVDDEQESAVVTAESAEAFDTDAGAERTMMESMPAGPPEYPIAPPPVVQADSGLPPWVWVMVGVLLANVFNKVLDFVRRPKEVMSEMMMKQMANAMNSQMGGGPGAGGPPPPFGFPTPPSAATPPPPAFDTWASPAAPSTPPPPVTPPPTPPAAPTPTPATSTPTVEATNGSGSGFDPAGLSGQQPVGASANGSASTEPQPSPSFFEDVGGESGKGASPGASAGAGAAASSAAAADDSVVDSFFDAMKDPSMRESLYQYLPEGMRNPETMEMVMNNPMVREQFKKMMAEKGGLEGMQAAGAAGFPAGNGEINKQLESMNIDPQVLVQKLMAEPDLWSLLQKPTVMNAVMDMQQNPNNVTKYMSDPEVMKVLMKMNELTFAAQAEAGGAPPGTPPAGMPGMPMTPQTPPPPKASANNPDAQPMS